MSLWSLRMLSVLRIVAALLFLEHGMMKLALFPAPQPGVPYPLPLLLQAAGAIEIVGGLLLAFGFVTRTAAFVCAGEMAFAYFLDHAPLGFWPGLNHGDAAILFCFIFLFVAVAGPGAWSVDALRKRHAAAGTDASSSASAAG